MLPLSPHSGPRRPVWPSDEGCHPLHHPELFVGGARKAKATGFGAQEKATVLGQREGCLPAAFIEQVSQHRMFWLVFLVHKSLFQLQ